MTTSTPAEQAADVLAELEAYRAEDLRDRKWAAFCRESDVRCLRCDLRYGERDQYGCGGEGMGPHAYDEAALAEAQKLDPPAIPRAPAGLLTPTLPGYHVELDANEVPTLWHGKRLDPFPRAVVNAHQLADDPDVWAVLVSACGGEGRA